MIFDPLHYLALLEQKPNALNQAAPLAGWELPEGFAQLRRLMEARLGKKGKREYVQVLRLLETFRWTEVSLAVEDALRLGAISSDAVKHLLLGPDRAAAGAAGPGALSAPAGDAGGHHSRRRLSDPAPGRSLLMDTPQVLLEHHLKALRLPTFLREYDKVAQQCAAEGVDFPRYLLRLTELELLDRERRATERRIHQAKVRRGEEPRQFRFPGPSVAE